MELEQIPQLSEYLSHSSGQKITIQDAKPLAGGASRDSWYLRAEISEPDGTKQEAHWVLRQDLPTQMTETALTRRQEYLLMSLAHKAGVKVAAMRFLCEDHGVLGSDFLIMDYMPGVSIGSKVIRDEALAAARAVLPEQLAQELAKIHQMEIGPELSFLRKPQPGLSPAEQTISHMRGVLDQLRVRNPVWEFLLRWCERYLPEESPLSFIHGDYRIGNILVDKSGLSAVIDWEFAHIGDFYEELGYICMRDWRFGKGHLRFAGLSDRDQFLKAYESARGISVNREKVDWWELMGNIRWGIICHSQADRHLSGADPSVELASLGRRSVEMQYEALCLVQRMKQI
ncbi:phosphotransferase family protein [Anaerolineales bacterium]